jgi:hypothetical protein
LGWRFRATDSNAAKNLIKAQWSQAHGGKIQCINSRLLGAAVLLLFLQASRRSNVTSLQVQLRLLRLQTLLEYGGCGMVVKKQLDDIQDLQRGIDPVWHVFRHPKTQPPGHCPTNWLHCV